MALRPCNGVTARPTTRTISRARSADSYKEQTSANRTSPNCRRTGTSPIKPTTVRKHWSESLFLRTPRPDNLFENSLSEIGVRSGDGSHTMASTNLTGGDQDALFYRRPFRATAGMETPVATSSGCSSGRG